MEYVAIKHLHSTFALLTLLSFMLRGYWMITESTMLSKKPVKILPHIIDTVLLISAITLVVKSGFYPFVVDWVTVKVFLLIAYIVLGVIALKRGKTKQTRLIAFAASLACIFAMFAAAVTKFSF